MEGLHRLDLLHLVDLLHHMVPIQPIDLLHPCRHRIDLLHHAVNPPTLRIAQHRPMYHLHLMQLARIVHHTLELPLIQQQALTGRLAHTELLHQGEHRLMQRRIVRARLIPAPTTRLLLLVDQLRHRRQACHIDLLLLFLMEQVHRIDPPRLMGLARQDQLLLIQHHLDLFQLLLMEQAHRIDPLPLMELAHRGQLLLTRPQHSDLLQLMEQVHHTDLPQRTQQIQLMEQIQLRPTDLPLPTGQAHHRDLLRHMGQVHRVDPPPAVRRVHRVQQPHRTDLPRRKRHGRLPLRRPQLMHLLRRMGRRHLGK